MEGDTRGMALFGKQRFAGCIREIACSEVVDRTRGVTLVELLVVLAIVAGVAALASPSLSRSLASRQVPAAASELAGALRAARGRAVARQGEILLVIDVGAQTYALGDISRQLTLPRGATVELVTARSEQLGQDRGGIRFFADGSSTGGVIAVRSDSVARSIVIDWITGLVDISSEDI